MPNPAGAPEIATVAGHMPGRVSYAGWKLGSVITAVAGGGIILHLVLRFAIHVPQMVSLAPLYLVLVVGGLPLLYGLALKLLAREYGSDLLAGISILTAVAEREFLVGSIVVLMLSGGRALEDYAARRASFVLDALAKRMPQRAHRRSGAEAVDVALDDIRIGDLLIIYPHEICPADGIIVEGQGMMNEAFLTGEPFEVPKAPGSQVISGALNRVAALTMKAEKLPVDSRYARIMRVMEDAQQRRPHLRRLGDQLGAWYTPAAIAVAIAAWLLAGDPHRFLAVLVIATPCPLLIAIPVTLIGAISLAASRGIIIKNPAILEQIDDCRTFIFDKTGTLTYGKPELTEIECLAGFEQHVVLRAAASLERYSRHPLASAIIDAATRSNLQTESASEISESPGQGLRGIVDGKEIVLTGRGALRQKEMTMPPMRPGLECVVVINGRVAAVLRFRDEPRKETRVFLDHLHPRHGVSRVLLVSGDRLEEARYLASRVGIQEVHAGKSPEDKVLIVRAETQKEKTLFVGDGINDAPAMQAATIGVAFGQTNEIAAEAADAVILESSLTKVDELIHIGRRARSIALQSAVGGMALSIVGMLFAAAGHLPAIGGAIAQEVIDLLAVLNAIRVALPLKALKDF